MANRESWEIAARLNRLYAETLGGKLLPTPLQVSHEDFYRLGGLKKLKSARYIEVAEVLLRDHGLILGRSDDFFLLYAAAAMPKATITKAAVTRELRRAAPSWPVPTKSTR